ncbi:MAG TPA: glycoside hydrolase family 28 protein [Bryobacteraceae bacterium]|nr:glycoside hydrolase family 28 protein [Bryobacteraceae bacterium]
MLRHFVHLSLLALLALPMEAATPVEIFNVKDYGALGNGRQKDTAAINRAIEACSHAGGGTVYVPPGRYLIGAITLQSGVSLDLEAGATLLGSPDPADYPLHANVFTPGRQEYSSLIYAEDAQDISLRGRGTIDGQGQNWWRRMGWPNRLKVPRNQRTPEELAAMAEIPYGRPQLIRFVRCKRVVIEGLHLINSPSWTIHPLLCEFVRVDGITIENPVPSPNTDGINPESSRNVQILNSRIDVGDDCVTLKSGRDEPGRRMGKPDENITITNCVMLRGHGGVTIGSEMSGGVHNVVVSNCVFQGTDSGIRIKSQRGRGGVVEGLTVSNIVMQAVSSAFTITTFYSGSDKPGDLFAVNDGTPRFRDFHFSNITARGSKTAGQITGLKEMPIEDVTFNGVHIQAQTGMKVTNARDVAFQDVIIDTGQGPAVTVVNSTGIDTSRLRSLKHESEPLVVSQK